MDRATLTTIGFDADDTLWQNEKFFRSTERQFTALLSDHGEHEVVTARLLEAERRNLAHYGFGAQGFILSMIETAHDMIGDVLPASTVRSILDLGRELLAYPVEILPGVEKTLSGLAGRYKIVLITKGDLFHQERKLAQSGLGDFFDAVEIVSDKKPETYSKLFFRHGGGPETAMMVGNSLKSDIIPAIAAGSWGVFIPHELTWVLEHAEAPSQSPRFRELASLSELPALLGEIT